MYKLLLGLLCGSTFVLGSITVANAAVTTFGCRGGTSCTMTQLFSGGTITVDDKVFDNFVLETTAPFSIIPDWTNVIVTGLDDGGLSPGPGLAIDGGGEFVATGLDEVAFEYSFDVNVTDPLLRIVDNSIEVASGAFDVMTEGSWEVGEQVSAGGSDLGSKLIFADGFFGIQDLSDTLAFAPQTSLDVVTSVFVGDFAGETISLDGYTQRFSQVVVPVPAAVWLLVSGLGALAGFGVRSRARRASAVKI